MNITKSLCLALCLSVGYSFTACDEDRNEVVYQTIQVPEDIFANGITAAPAGESQTFYVNSPATVSAHVEKVSDGDAIDWIEVSVGDRTDSGYPVTIKTVANETRGPRMARVAVFAGNVARGVILTQPTNAPTVAAETPIADVTARELASRMYAGVNIGNTLEAPDGEGSWTRPVTIEYIRGLKAAGFNAVRIPCAWNSHIDGNTSKEKAKNIIKAEWLERVDQVVEWVIGEGMYAIVNIHWDGGWLENNLAGGYDEDIDKKQHDFWTQIAKKLNHFDEHLLFAGMNEPGLDGTITDVAVDAIIRYQQTFVDAVRAVGGNNASRCLVVQGPQTNIDETVKGRYKLPVDIIADRMFVEVHNYDPSDFTIMETDGQWAATVKLYWGADNMVPGSDRNCTWADAAYINGQYKKMHDTFVANGIPVIVGEYSSAVRNASDFPGMDVEKHQKSRADWNEVMTRSAKDNGCVPFYWETGSDINRTTGEVINPYAIDGLMRGASAGVYPF